MPWRSILSRFGLPVFLGLCAGAVFTNALKSALNGGPGWSWPLAAAALLAAAMCTLWGYRRSQKPSCPYEALGRRDYLERTLAASESRRHRRRLGVGLTEAQAQRSLTHRARIPTTLDQFEPGSIRVLTGPLGSGKSEIAEEWFRERITHAQAEDAAPIPVWIRIDELGSALEDKVIAEVGRDALKRFGSDIVIDGLDERTQKAGSALVQAHEFATGSPKCRVLLTSRALPSAASQIALTTQAVVTTPLLSAETSAALINKVAGESIGPLGNQLQEAVGRPLFALLVARHAAAAKGATGIPELIDLVVHDIVEADDFDLYQHLRKLAVETIRQGGPVDPAAFTTADVVARLRKSPLIDSRDRLCVFSLATFEQWFAAKALTEGEVSIDGLLDSLETFDRWKYVLAIVLAAGEPSRVDPVMASVARWNPGAAAWLIRETQRGGLSRTAPDIRPDDWETVGHRLRAATQAWLDGLGPLAAAFQPFVILGSTDFSQLSVAVDVGTHNLSVDWLPSAQAAPPLPPVMTLEQVNHGRYHVFVDRFHPLPRGMNWVWQTTREHLADDLTSRLIEVVLGLAEHSPGVTQNETRELEAARERWAAGIPPGPTEDSLYPFPDIPSSNEFPWGSSTIETMHTRLVAVAAAAMQCYLEMTSVVAQRFGDTLCHRALMPAQFYGVTSYRPTPPTGANRFLLPRGTGARWLLRPIGARQANGDRTGSNEVSITVNDDARESALLDDKDALYSEFLSYLGVFPACAPFAVFSITSGQIDVLETRPATRIALRWLWDDLADLGWVRHPMPHLVQ